MTCDRSSWCVKGSIASTSFAGVDFHAILQCEGAFVPEKAQSKQYSRFFSGYSLEQVQRMIVAALDSEPGLADSYPQSADRVSKS